MANEKYISFDINDERTEKIAAILGNKTCKKILNLLTEKELSEGDIAKELNLPINTVEYNLKKLIEAGLIEKTSNFFWSVRGKKIATYKVANKKIIISPTSKVKGVLASILVGGLVLGGLKTFINYLADKTVYSSSFQSGLSENYATIAVKAAPSLGVAQNAGNVAQTNIITSTSNINILQDVWLWVIIGMVLGLIWIFLYRKLIINVFSRSHFDKEMKGGNN